MRMVAQIGGFLGRKRDGDPGATVLWRGLDKLSLYHQYLPALPSCAPHWAVDAVSGVGNSQAKRISAHPSLLLRDGPGIS